MPAFRRGGLVPGIYDELVTEHLAGALGALSGSQRAITHDVKDAASAAALVATAVRDATELAVAESRDADAILELGRRVLALLREHAPRSFPSAGELALRPQRLAAIVPRPATEIERPRGPLHASSLIVNAEGDALLDHLRSEFASADRVDLLCSFVKLSGFERLRGVLEAHCVGRARKLRVLTTTYMGATDALAVERIAALSNAAVKVSYDATSTRLHAKAWVFWRASGFSTAYVGSSNLSHAAQTDGLEWNVRITESDQPALFAQITETFEQYWADRHLFDAYDAASKPAKERLRKSLAQSSGARGDEHGFLAEIEAKDFQRPVLEELEAARRLGQHRNLVVAATGTGKTVMAALDYRSLRERGGVDTLLYVAHRREILEQARTVFRAVLQVREFGELLFGGERPAVGRHVFASIDSLLDGCDVDPADFDHVVVDEAHHAAADTWTRLLDRIRPKELVGLTGTPERADGLDYDAHFPRPWIGNIRVWNAIPHALVPFRYYMLDVEGVDLGDVAWTGGRYAVEALAGKLLGAAELFVRRAVRALAEHVARPAELRAIAFCVNLRHAEEIANRLRAEGFRTETLSGDSSASARRAARSELDAGRIQVLCVVDLYNEGVDVPNVNTLLFFRPTESATVFLQQLGRGLRRARGKSELVVFDLTGRQHRNFRFDRKLRGLLGHTPRALHEFVHHGFGRLPSGCFVHFEERSREAVLDQIRRAIPDDRSGLQQLLREPAHAELSLAAFLRETDVALADVYRTKRSWSELRASVGLDRRPRAAGEDAALANLHKLIHVGDALRLGVWERLLKDAPLHHEWERRAARMLFAVLYGKKAASGEAARERWSEHVVVRTELAELVPVLRAANAIRGESDLLEPDVPLVVHPRYLGVELSAAFDHRTKKGLLRDYFTGVESTGDRRYDMLLTTLEKAAAVKEHLRYRDFPMSEMEFHWQSKSRTTGESTEGRRHLDPAAQGCTPLLFVRERGDDRPGVTMAFCYLGPVEPGPSEGERPITVTWRLRYAMPTEMLRVGRIAA